MFDEIKKLVFLNGVSGNETKICEYIKSQLVPYADKVYTDVLGNLVAVKRGSGKRILLMAHTDEIGIVATFVDEKGFVRVAPVGGVSPSDFLNSKVTFENGVRGVFACEKKDGKMADSFVDIGCDSFEETLSKIDIGMTARFDSDCFETEKTIVSKTLDDRLGCYILMETLKNMKPTENEVYFVFTSQQEVGYRGAKICGYDINPDVAIAVDTTLSSDTPGCDIYGCKLHNGVAIKIRDASAICSKSVVESLENIANDNLIPYQPDVLTAGGTDVGAVQTGGRGALVGGVGVAVRYAHTGSEIASKKDIQAAIDLLIAYVEKNVENNA